MVRTYLYRYYHRGDEYGFEIPANSREEADARLKSLQRKAEYDGELVARVPAVPGAGLLVRLLTWMRG